MMLFPIGPPMDAARSCIELRLKCSRFSASTADNIPLCKCVGELFLNNLFGGKVVDFAEFRAYIRDQAFAIG
jgi:hypothetical protein